MTKLPFGWNIPFTYMGYRQVSKLENAVFGWSMLTVYAVGVAILVLR